MDAFYPLMVLSVLVMTSEVMLHKVQERESRFIQNAFSSYLSPVLLKKLMQEPERLALGGEKKELTIFFSDIRSFTSISETMDPQRLTQFLNRYFTPMSDIVLKHQGMIDKYIGDAVMAFYNAPLDVKEHAACACRSALEMIDELEELNKTFRQEGLPEIAIGIGLNTAEVVVGNMGSAKRFNYTVIGDGVNLASRVEGLNKVYGTHILITEFTKACIGDEFLTRALERVKVKGKEEAVMLFELLKDTPANRELCQQYDAAMQLYKEGKISEAIQKLEGLPNDSVSRYFIGIFHSDA
jgi:adenylate cyclase